MDSVKRDFLSTAPMTVPTHDVVSLVDPVTGITTHESWWKDNKLDRADGPLVIKRNPVTGITTHESWWKDNKLDRADGPSVIKRNPVTGITTYEAWYKDGVEIKPPQRPASPIPRAPAP